MWRMRIHGRDDREITTLEEWETSAERKTYFDAVPGGPRNHDLLVVAHTQAEKVVVAVEGKADEPFDLPVSAWLAQREKQSAASGARARLDGLSQSFFGSTLDSDPALGEIRYQLLSMLAGALADAKDASAERAVVLIHEFVTDETQDHKQHRTPLTSKRSSPGSRERRQPAQRHRIFRGAG